MKKLFFALLVLCGVAAWSVPSVRGEAQGAVAVSKLDTRLNIVPDKSKKTDEGIRLTMCVMGMPHTAQRIDSVDLHVAGKVYKANDIDPIEFEKYFQFEDDGLVVLEIDFPFSGELPRDASLTFHTLRGDVKAPARQ